MPVSRSDPTFRPPELFDEESQSNTRPDTVAVVVVIIDELPT